MLLQEVLETTFKRATEKISETLGINIEEENEEPGDENNKKMKDIEEEDEESSL